MPTAPLFTGSTIFFLVPYGSAGSHFVTELAKLYESFGSASAMECIALESRHGATCSSPETS